MFDELKKTGDSLALGWSGGIDSTALLLMLKDAGFMVQAWHIDHGWHPASAEHAEQLRFVADTLDVAFHSRRLTSATHRNREACARQGRYQMWQEMAHTYGIRRLCLAHHADDQAETICLRMLQGAGVQGCCGMTECRPLKQGLTLYRPLLKLRKQVLQQRVAAANIPIIEDPSNQDTSLRRNYIRHCLFPAMQRAGYDPCQLYLRFQRQASRCWQIMEQHMAIIPWQQQDAWVHMQWQDWASSTPAIRAALLQRMMQALHGEGRRLGRRHILLAEQWLQHGGHHGLDLAGCRLLHQGEQLSLYIP